MSRASDRRRRPYLLVFTDLTATGGLRSAGARKTVASVSASNVEPPHVSTDPSVKLDYDIVYVRAPRRGDDVGTNWAEVSSPLFMDAGADLMLLHPDGNEEVLVAGGKGSVADPMVSFDGEWVYYSLFHDLDGATITEAARAGADIYKIHVKTRRVVRLTHQQFTPNTGAGNWSKDFRTPEPGKNSSRTAFSTRALVRCRAARSSSPATAMRFGRPSD